MSVSKAIASALGAIGVILLLMFTWPQYNIWQQGLAGQARLAKAEQEKKIRIEDAISRKEAARHDAETDLIRAKGVSAANKEIADGLGGADGYLRWLYIEMLRETGGKGRETIYVPTEAGLPIMEANRLKSQ